MKRFQMKAVWFSLVIGLSFFTFYSDSALSESRDNPTDYPLGQTLGDTETVYISINQVSPMGTAGQTTLEQASLAAGVESPVEIALENLNQAVKTVQMEICDEDDYLTLSTCATTDRTAAYLCRASESSTTGCCTVRLFSFLPNVSIAAGSGPIFVLNYLVSEEAPPGECRTIDTASSIVTDPDGSDLDAIVSPGEYCFSVESESCAVSIAPAGPDTVLSGETIQFTAHTTGTGCAEPSYSWEVTGESDATIDDTGLYCAGFGGGTDVITVVDTANDYLSATAAVEVLLDSDLDGIPDDAEEDCPASNFELIVTIDGCETGVDNHLLPDGCTLSDQIASCAEEAPNHGRFVFCVTRRTLEWKRDNLITFRNMGAIIRCAAWADIP